MPPNSRKILYWDSCVWLSYINAIPDRLPIIDALLAESASEKGKIMIYTSVISQVEVAFGIVEQTKKILDPQIESEIDELWADRDTLKLLEFHELIGLQARNFMRLGVSRGWQLKPIDAIHLATAKSIPTSEFNTYDTDLIKYSSDLGFPVTEPHTIAPLLL